ncbi:MAG: hypothetical protein ABFS24_06500 [Pseudomonadota bacterium]
MNTLKAVSMVALLGVAVAMSSAGYAQERTKGRGTGPTVFVTSQGLYYDSIVVADPLPFKGRFQQLVPDENGLSTDYGPGEVGHLGGRWWVDINDNQRMDKNDHYFLCPLLGPGRDHL